MQRKPPSAMGGEMGALEGATEGVIKAAKVAAGAAVPLGAAALGVSVPLGEGEADTVVVAVGESLPVAEAGAGAEVGESVPVAEAAAGAGVAEAVGEAAAPPGAGRAACHTPPHAMYCGGHAVEPLCWQHVKRGAGAERGLKCIR